MTEIRVADMRPQARVSLWLRTRAAHVDNSQGLMLWLPDSGPLSKLDQEKIFTQLAADADHSWLLLRLFNDEEPMTFDTWRDSRL